MKRKIKGIQRGICLLLATSMMFTACSSSSETTSSSSTSSSTTSSSSSSSTSTSETTTATTEDSTTSSVPEYLHVGSTLPIVKEGYDKTLSFMVQYGDGSVDPYDTWFWTWVQAENGFNLNADVSVIANAAMAQQKTLAFASGTLPDIMIDMGLSTSDIVMYGAVDKQIIPVDPYLNEENMPNAYAIYQEYPEYKGMVSAQDGNMYGLGRINSETSIAGSLTGGISDFRINSRLLDEAGLEIPTTLDDFIDMLRAFRDITDDDFIPFGGSVNWAANGMATILTALGATSKKQSIDPYLHPSIRNDEAIFTYADREIWKPFLETYYTMYQEGLISLDYFTMDQSTATALFQSDLCGVYAGSSSPGVLGTDELLFVSGTPLTSDWNDTPIWTDADYVTANAFVVTSACEEPELAFKFGDFMFDTHMRARAWTGPAQSDEDIKYDLLEGWYNKDGVTLTWPEVDSGDWTLGDLRTQVVFGLYTWGCEGLGENFARFEIQGDEPVNVPLDPTTNAGARRIGNLESLAPHRTDGFPTIAYFTEAESQLIVDYSTVINAYVQVEFAKFVTGERPITDEELEKFYAALDQMGYQEYASIYIDYYNNYKAMTN